MIATNESSIHEVIAKRASARAFAERPVAAADLQSVLEAARWAASSYNAQPWRFLVVRREDAARFETVLSVLVPMNRAWAASAPVLIVTVARMNYPHNEKPNRHAWHDVGLATGNLMTQAAALGMVTGPMGGFDSQAARERLHIPEGWDPVAVIALGYPADAGAQPAKPRERKPLEEIVYGADWGEPITAASENEEINGAASQSGVPLTIH